MKHMNIKMIALICALPLLVGCNDMKMGNKTSSDDVDSRKASFYREFDSRLPKGASKSEFMQLWNELGRKYSVLTVYQIEAYSTLAYIWKRYEVNQISLEEANMLEAQAYSRLRARENAESSRVALELIEMSR
jgi:hypothetical protein